MLLVEQARNDVGVAGELVEHERHGRGGRVVAGEQQRHDLVADLAVGEGGAMLVGGVHEQREHVLAARAAGAPAGDLRADQAGERALGFLLTIPGRERSAEHAQGVVAGVEGQGLLEQGGGVDRARGGAVGIQAEQRAHGDAQGQPARPGVEVDGLAGNEGAVQRGGGLLDHRVERGEDALAVEGGEHDLAGGAVKVAVGREQAVAGEADQVAEVGGAPEEVGGVGDGDVVVGLGPEREHGVGVEEPEREDGPEALVGLEQQRQGVVGEALGAGKRGRGFPGRERHGGGALVEEILDEGDERVVGAQRWGAGERYGGSGGSLLKIGWLASLAGGVDGERPGHEGRRRQRRRVGILERRAGLHECGNGPRKTRGRSSAG